jgi:hypothetical protein
MEKREGRGDHPPPIKQCKRMLFAYGKEGGKGGISLVIIPHQLNNARERCLLMEKEGGRGREHGNKLGGHQLCKRVPFA